MAEDSKANGQAYRIALGGLCYAGGEDAVGRVVQRQPQRIVHLPRAVGMHAVDKVPQLLPVMQVEVTVRVEVRGQPQLAGCPACYHRQQHQAPGPRQMPPHGGVAGN